MRDAEYWKQRAIDALIRSEQSVLDYEKRLNDAYDFALASIRKEIESFYVRYAKENKIPYSEARRRLDAGQRKEFNALLKEWYRVAQEAGIKGEYSEYLKTLGKQVYITRLESLEASIRFQIEKLKNEQHSGMTDLMTINYIAGYYSGYYNFAQGVEVAVNFATIDAKSTERAVKTRWDKKNYSDRIWADRDALIDSISKIIPRSFSMGQNSRELGDMIAKQMNVSKNRGRTLARTEVNYICNQSTMDVYAAGNVMKYEYLATLDMRTSEVCRHLDGFIGLRSQAAVGVNYPPMHPNCRSTTIPHFEDDDTLERIARDEEGNNIKVPRRMTQEQWIKKYCPEDQRDKLLRFLDKYPSEE